MSEILPTAHKGLVKQAEQKTQLLFDEITSFKAEMKNFYEKFTFKLDELYESGGRYEKKDYRVLKESRSYSVVNFGMQKECSFDVFMKICEDFSYSELAKLSLVCRDWNRLIHSSSFAKHQLKMIDPQLSKQLSQIKVLDVDWKFYFEDVVANKNNLLQMQKVVEKVRKFNQIARCFDIKATQYCLRTVAFVFTLVTALACGCHKPILSRFN